MAVILGENARDISIEQMNDRYQSESKEVKTGQGNEATKSFSDVLQQLKFSKHAAKRLDDRNISLSEDQNERLTRGVAKAGEKGVQDSLVMVDSMAFIVNVPTQTVITALDEKESAEHIFTNIDGTVIA